MAFSDETVFVTGFPGFIAGRLVKRLARQHARFILLVQPALLERASEEVALIISEIGGNAENFSIVEGDITKPGLGVSADEFERARNETTTLFHLAAIYDLAVARNVAMRVNVEGTRNVNKFARMTKSLHRYHYISTCYVSGKREGIIMEAELLHDAGFRNHYEETKYLAELEVDALKSELPITIHRPAVVCRDSFATVPAGIVYPVLMLPFASKITGLPHSAVPYFFLEQTYDTRRACELLEPHGVRCPSFPEYVSALVDFVARHPTLG